MPNVGRSAPNKSHTQSVLFSKDTGWSKAGSKKWVKDHDNFTDGYEETDSLHRWRQYDPNGEKFRYRNKVVEKRDEKTSITLVLGFPKSREFEMNDKLLMAIKARNIHKTEFNYGVLTADSYVRTLQDCVGLDVCNRFASKSGRSFEDLMQKAAKTLVYSNSDMDVGAVERKRTGNKLRGVELPKNTLMVFQHVLTSSRKDRDGDILRSEGAEVDPSMLLLWQHVSTLPIGKMIKVVSQNKKSLKIISAIVDMNKLCHDAAVMVDNGMGRFSHGFRALEFEPMKDKEGETEGFDVKSFEIMEESLVSVPSNVDAETEEVLLSLVEGGKLTSPLMKQVGKGLRERRNLVVPVGEIQYRESSGNGWRELSCSSFAELKEAADAGLIGAKENDDDKTREGTETSLAKEADATDEGKETETNESGNKEVKETENESKKIGEAHIVLRMRNENASAKELMADFLSVATPWERARMAGALEALALSDKQKKITEQYRAMIGPKE